MVWLRCEKTYEPKKGSPDIHQGLLYWEIIPEKAENGLLPGRKPNQLRKNEAYFAFLRVPSLVRIPNI